MTSLTCDRAWNTSGVRPSERFSYWSEAINGVLAPRQLKSTSRQDFSGTLLAYSVGSISMTHGDCSPLTVTRSYAEISRGAANFFYLVCPLQGSLVANQLGRMALVAPNQCVLIFTEEPFSLDFRHTANALTAQIPYELIFNRVPQVLDLTCVNLCGDTASGAALSSHMSALPHNRLRESPPHAAIMSRILLDLIEITLRELSDPIAGEDRAGRRVGAETVSNFIAAHIRDPLLSPARAARALAVSERSIHLAMQHTGESFMSHVRSRRLMAVAAELEADASRERRISDIAFEWGFNDLSVLNRLFRARFGMPPSAYRRQSAIRISYAGEAHQGATARND